MFVTLLLGCCVEQRHARFHRILPYIFTLFKSFVQQFLACLCGDTQRRATEWKLAEQARQNRKAKRIAQVRSSHSPSNPKWSCIFYGSRVGLFAWGFAFVCLIAFLFLLLAWACSGFLTTWHPLKCLLLCKAVAICCPKKSLLCQGLIVCSKCCLQFLLKLTGPGQSWFNSKSPGRNRLKPKSFGQSGVRQKSPEQNGFKPKSPGQSWSNPKSLGQRGFNQRVLDEACINQRVMGKVGLNQRVLHNVGLIVFRTKAPLPNYYREL